MKSKLIQHDGEKTYALVFEKDEEVIEILTAFAKKNNLAGSHFTAIGAFSDVTLGYFDRERKDYKKILINEQVEVLSLVGNIALSNGESKLHAHVVVGKSDGTAYGGHILKAHVWPTLEVVLTESPKHLRRKTDEETRLPLIELKEVD